MSSSSDLTHDDVARILGIIDKLNDIEVRLEVDGMKLHVRKFSGAHGASRHIEEFAPMQAESVPQAAQAALVSGRNPAPAPTPAPAPAPELTESAKPLPATAPVLAPTVEGSAPVTIRAPMLGRFFRASSPTEAPYVEIGSKVEPDDTVCMIEVMKLFSTVKAGVRGTIVHVAVENGDMVEHDAVLFSVKPE